MYETKWRLASFGFDSKFCQKLVVWLNFLGEISYFLKTTPFLTRSPPGIAPSLLIRPRFHVYIQTMMTMDVKYSLKLPLVIKVFTPGATMMSYCVCLQLQTNQHLHLLQKFQRILQPMIHHIQRINLLQKIQHILQPTIHYIQRIVQLKLVIKDMMVVTLIMFISYLDMLVDLGMQTTIIVKKKYRDWLHRRGRKLDNVHVCKDCDNNIGVTYDSKTKTWYCSDNIP